VSPDAVAENVSIGTQVGLLTANDADVGDSFTFSFASGPGDTNNGSFTISGDQLLTAEIFDHELQAEASVRLKVVDSYGLEVEKELLITITDDRTEDFDMDYLTEAEEEDVYGTSDTDKDSDDDGFEDGFEAAYGFNPDSNLDGTLDRDEDGTLDWLELRLGWDGDVPNLPVELENFPAGLPFGQSVTFTDLAAPTERGFYRLEFYPLPLPVTAADGFTWVTVGVAVNPVDPATGYGAVAVEFQISAYEVTIGQWVEFLNAKQTSEPANGAEWLWLPSMVTDQNVAGIARNGADGSYTYEATGSPERPVTFVSWLDAARYVNWLHNGKGSGDTESGVYNMSLSPELITRAPGATYFLPTRDEWYKAAYFDPTKGGTNYWLYPTRSDTEPGNNLPAAANFANFRNGDYALTPGDNTYSGTTQYLTQVGSFAESASHYGTYDQAGSVWEWTETPDGTNRKGRGGTWGSGGIHLLTTSSRNDDPAIENAGLGFRIAKPAEP
jgi:sulfatase modifying factor 1